ncbi:MAG: CDP-diacylglycerol--glycerol-3-phosphate 3-phosphatidyltransferase [SAR324 cluster bacterium]|nr:CDP-diacylglycerol--glycerol-3-phosphate 3-phosphatidyltransferase [SAR324 cluster bacterium]MBF0352738.1 CDP-diacylglycerol--glycerol-3-phosphate 3-phosphatidyltransferase [SAR324 cluster bacterium]
MLGLLSKLVTPNQLTVARMFLIPVIYLLIWIDTPGILFAAAVLYTIACFTDYLDGVLARFEGKSTPLGKLLDPIADKVLVSSILVLLVAMDRAPAIATVILISREFAISGLRSIAVVDGLVIGASWAGKLKTLIQMISIGFLIVHHDTWHIPFHIIGLVLLWASAVISLWSGVEYFMAYYRNTPHEEPQQ